MSEKAANILGRSLDWKVRQHFVRTYEALWRELDYSLDKGSGSTTRAVSKGWAPPRLRLVAVLNAFSRTVLGPLAAAFARKGGVDLGHHRSISYGKLVTVNDVEGRAPREALTAFDLLCLEARVHPKWLHLNRMSDIVYAINRVDDEPSPATGE